MDFSRISHFFRDKRKPGYGALDILKYIGPGLLVTVGFIDPGNWASNLSAGSDFGYQLLWMITLSTIMLIILQHNVAHLGIATGLCLAEAATKYLPRRASRFLLVSAMGASVSTSLAEILGASVALDMLFNIPIPAGAFLTFLFVMIMLLTNTYTRVEKFIIAFVSVIGLSFLYELTLVDINWASVGIGWVKPTIPQGSIIIIMSVMGAVVMPHNLFLHSEIIQSRQWNLEDDKMIKRQMDFELYDTLFSMILGWAINSAMIILAASTFFQHGISITELPQATAILRPLLGNHATEIFAFALLLAGVSSAITSGIAGGSIFAGFFGEPYDIRDVHSRWGVVISLLLAMVIIFFIRNPFHGLVISQMILSIQLPFTILFQVYLTSSGKVMGKYKNTKLTTITLLSVGAVVIFLNIRLFLSLVF
ncbi:MAG: Nramp family divalent metal transporter [Bacteroidetes bacterium]|nr:Nramp family divalent metal transporter [Bacteroidota bacterium]